MTDRTRIILETYVDYVDMKNFFMGRKMWSDLRSYMMNPDTLAKRKDLGAFIKAADKIGNSPTTRRNLLINAFIKNEKAFILDAITPENYDETRARFDYLRSAEERFFDDVNDYLQICKGESISFVDSLIIGDPPLIIQALESDLVREETVVVLNFVVPFLGNDTRDLARKARYRHLIKYSHFVFPYFEQREHIKEAIHAELIRQS